MNCLTDSTSTYLTRVARVSNYCTVLYQGFLLLAGHLNPIIVVHFLTPIFSLNFLLSFFRTLSLVYARSRQRPAETNPFLEIMQQNVGLQTKAVGYLQRYIERQMWTSNNHERNRLTACELCRSWLIRPVYQPLGINGLSQPL
jgi:hypothetical protein